MCVGFICLLQVLWRVMHLRSPLVLRWGKDSVVVWAWRPRHAAEVPKPRAFLSANEDIISSLSACHTALVKHLWTLLHSKSKPSERLGPGELEKKQNIKPTSLPWGLLKLMEGLLLYLEMLGQSLAVTREKHLKRGVQPYVKHLLYIYCAGGTWRKKEVNLN